MRSTGPPFWRWLSQSSGTVKLRLYHILVMPTSPRPTPAGENELDASHLLHVSLAPLGPPYQLLYHALLDQLLLAYIDLSSTLLERGSQAPAR